MNNSCPCCSGNEFEVCCKPYLNGLPPPTPETLMRSRYTAYTLVEIDYLIETTHPSMRKYYSRKSMEAWAKACKWQKLEVKQAHDDKVEFYAYFIDENNQLQVHKEHSTFKKEGEKWYFVDGVHV